MKTIRILWADDEIDLLKPHLLFLEGKGYSVTAVTNGDDAIEQVNRKNFDIIFLDENMPGLSGLETLASIKNVVPGIPVVMITKSEEEDIMEEAIGAKIADYLIKPVNPNQILLSIKKNIEKTELVTRKTTSAYQSEFARLGMQINDSLTHEDWVEVYRKLVFWELELEESDDHTMDEVLLMQKSEANQAFSRFVKKNYFDWLEQPAGERPLISPDLFRHRVFPLLDQGEKVFVLLIDNLRYDQWRILQQIVREYYTTDEEELYFSILPTATMYARNAIFSGLMPSEIAKTYPNLWLNEEEEGIKNQHEEELFTRQMARYGRSEKFSFEKMTNLKSGRRVLDNLANMLENPLSVMVINFVDIMSHARTEMDMIRELANDEAAYRSLTESWFRHSPLLELIKELSTRDIKLVVTTDHGTIRVHNPLKVIGERSTNTNLRYKQGRNLKYNRKEVFEMTNPGAGFLPSSNVSSTFIFASGTDFFAYPNNFNYYVSYYRDTFQHGGISLEEMLVPFVTLSPR
ncbi:bifunctional response regulator/alkaline phosphatase family protein [Prolixibacter denitrificans]|uniref:Response regulator receiver domain-containing protein n=1 Tax=Prolixibacter denitrificans TaxID=1541063 RepID=A0A2P8CHZ1_9BACT|nr:bifunctional response regulator/alkaline phosphatase family protein [Prolixibacter denitrificans]PSK84587.1 response regulator receiver domain-containing protein [Prolixibacter denitrificans]GET20754.1 two-component system response regulator [Prolixibacter denitrificans]